MKRREFLVQCGVAAVVIPAAMMLGACGGGGGSGAPATGFTVTSTPDQTSHSHTVTILFTDLTNPPAAGKIFTTSPGGTNSHTHTLTVTQAQLTDINIGGTENISTSTDFTHNHQFQIHKP
jgi:uncharacterized cupredoxin-like copper-binding protein